MLKQDLIQVMQDHRQVAVPIEQIELEADSIIEKVIIPYVAKVTAVAISELAHGS